ncbi:MAG TPA: hypothetical protein VEO53_16375 [Candidatus Binatia bacterium]|nr:hypothetical protein [Candidatus Binatia bacterium]
MKTTRWHSCNVLRIGRDSRQLWHFAAGNGELTLSAEQRLATPGPLPAKLVTKNWRALWQKKLNIAWLPAEQVFLQVVHLPKCEPAELRSMVELQLEKLAPLPVNQIVWSFEVVPQSAGELQTVIVIIVERSVVEAFLGSLESDGYLADRLDLPFLHQLLATPFDVDSAWVYLQPTETKNLGLVAWWYGGTLQQLNLLNLPAGEQGATALGDQLTTIAWGGELEGWLTSRPQWHLVADNTVAAVWEPALSQWADEPVKHVPPLALADLAALSAQRAARAESTASLLPEEFTTRYQQLFIDRLWMGGLGALAIVYLAGVVIYVGALQILKIQTGKVQNQVAALSGGYTSARQLKDRVKLLQEQVSLKYAALDCLRVVSELLPPELTLNALSVSFQTSKLSLSGRAQSDQRAQITKFNDDLKQARVNEEKLFDTVNPALSQTAPGAATTTWSFTCDLKMSDTE